LKAYLDIETSFSGEITILGIYFSDGRLIQLVEDDVNRDTLLDTLNPTDSIVTYNGSRFDLPVIRNKLDVDLNTHYKCHDLMYDCWKRNLYGGLKKVEAQLGIDRESQGIDGWEAMRLWENYKKKNDQKALTILLHYNRDDVINLATLEKKLTMY
jgi:uncharacterized protein YprB with RNaseH-like and TPR domain